jgi:hypothetical protein
LKNNPIYFVRMLKRVNFWKKRVFLINLCYN